MSRLVDLRRARDLARMVSFGIPASETHYSPADARIARALVPDVHAGVERELGAIVEGPLRGWLPPSLTEVLVYLVAFEREAVG